MKFNSKCVNNMYRSIFIIISALLSISCSRTGAERLFLDEYPELYKAVYSRNADSIMTFTAHESEFVQRQAWRAMISTPVNDLDYLFSEVLRSQHEAAWVALSKNELNDEQIMKLHNMWEIVPSLRDEISTVLGQQGNERSLDFLVRNLHKIIDTENEYKPALAIGRLISRFEISEQSERVIIRHATVQPEPEVVRAYLYGYFRSGKKIEDDELQDIIINTYKRADKDEIKVVMLRVAFQNDAEKAFNNLSFSDASKMNVQLAIELVRQLNSIIWNDDLSEVYSDLLRHQNPVVNEAALQMLAGRSDKPSAFDTIIEEKIIHDEEKEASVRLSGIIAHSEPSEFTELAESLAGENHYLLIKLFEVKQKILPASEFLSYIKPHIRSEEREKALSAVNALSTFWIQLSEGQKSNEIIQEVHDLLNTAINKNDRSITYLTQPLLLDEKIAAGINFSYYNNLLTNYKLPEDVEVYQSISQVLMRYYKNEAGALIDSLAAMGNAALNNTLRTQGWEIEEEDSEDESHFRAIDWDRLTELGFYPVWVLETEKGTIKIEMDPIIAPATIAGMDSLIRNGEYDNTAFHRVVPNFVIQGGDVESGDGFGGPDYVVPTEASEKDYERGVVGIASAGTDTEGSQYFIMHQWAPHLNGNYTVVGKVIEGMDVVDKILVGDNVIRSYWGESN